MNDDRNEALVALLVLLGGIAILLGISGTVPDSGCRDGTCPVQIKQLQASEPLPYGAAETPVMNLPAEMRTSNWGGGSCVHASTYHLLNWQGQYDMAKWWRSTYSGGEYSDRLNKKMDAAGLKYAYTVQGDAAFLEWAMRTRRGAGITYFPNHAINLVHLDGEKAGLLDNNRKDQIIWVERNTFLRNWKSYGGWAWTLVYDPPAPLPHL